MNTQEALKFTVDNLKDSIKNPHFEAELLLSASLSKPREFILIHPEYILEFAEEKNLLDYISKRNDNNPLAYITNHKSFYGLNFYVNENVLIPRPETELMVDEVLHIVNQEKNNYDSFTIIDLGTGSGCIIISVVKNLVNFNKSTNFFAVDISEPALQIAKKNSKTHKLDTTITFKTGNLLSPICAFVKNLCICNNKIVITANLPYLTKEQIESSPSIKKEPKLALDGGKDGMELYIELFKQVSQLKTDSGADITLLAEIDHTQIDEFKKECFIIFPNAILDIKKDLGGYERCVVISF